MLPRATHQRTRREVQSGKPSGRTQEIQRLIGRSLRAAVDLKALGERQIVVDCDVLQADGGTRTAAITGAWLALKAAVSSLMEEGVLKADPVIAQSAAVSAGVGNGDCVCGSSGKCGVEIVRIGIKIAQSLQNSNNGAIDFGQS